MQGGGKAYFMDFKILDKKDNPLLKREEATAEITGNNPSTPSRKEIMAEASKSLGVPEDLIIVDRISTERGKKEVEARIFVYKKREDIPKSKIEKMERRISGMVKKTEPSPAPKKEKAAK